MRIGAGTLDRRGDADLGQELDRPLAGGGSGEAEMPRQHLAQLVADREDRVEARHRLLEDHTDAATAHRIELRLAKRGEVASFKADVPAGDRAGGTEEPHDGER